MTEVAVEVVEPPAEEAPATTVVVADTGSDNDNDLQIGVALGALTTEVATLAAIVGEQGERLAMVEARVESAQQQASTATEIAIDAAIDVEEALEVAEEVAEETAEEAVEELIEPQREHRIWRSPIRIRRNEGDA